MPCLSLSCKKLTCNTSFPNLFVPTKKTESSSIFPTLYSPTFTQTKKLTLSAVLKNYPAFSESTDLSLCSPKSKRKPFLKKTTSKARIFKKSSPTPSKSSTKKTDPKRPSSSFLENRLLCPPLHLLPDALQKTLIKRVLSKTKKNPFPLSLKHKNLFWI